MLRTLLLLSLIISSLAAAFPVPKIEWAPKGYLCPRAGGELNIDGVMDEAAWNRAPWTDPFVDIEGELKRAPHFLTRAKMLWDDEYFYVAAYMEEPHLWATYRERDSVIYHENDFEVFIDPDGDNHEYYELEINALGTEWDLFLGKPYRDGGPAIHGWDIAGLITAVALKGSINDPTDQDRCWTVEIAFPWKALAEAAHRDCPPKLGDRWRVNFSRVQWQLDVTPLGYSKRPGPGAKALPENNWVWSPQGLIAMHYPEMWGFVEFAEDAGEFELRVADLTRWELCRLYYLQKQSYEEAGAFLDSIEGAALHITPSGFEIIALDADGGEHHIDETGHLW
jgi:hypothetical protein